MSVQILQCENGTLLFLSASNYVVALLHLYIFFQDTSLLPRYFSFSQILLFFLDTSLPFLNFWSYRADRFIFKQIFWSYGVDRFISQQIFWSYYFGKLLKFCETSHISPSRYFGLQKEDTLVSNIFANRFGILIFPARAIY